MSDQNTRRVDGEALGRAMGLLWAGAVVVLGLTARRGWGEEWRELLSDVYLGYDRDARKSLQDRPQEAVRSTWKTLPNIPRFDRSRTGTRYCLGVRGWVCAYLLARLYNLFQRTEK